MVAASQYSLVQIVGAWVALIMLVLWFCNAVIGIAHWFSRAGNSTPDVDADIRILMADELHLHQRGTAEYGATNEAREMITRGRQGRRS